MKDIIVNDKEYAWNLTSWVFCLIFLVLGILNMFLVHVVPGGFYILLALFYYPPITTFLKIRLGFSIPPVAKIILGIIVLWATLAVGELAEMVGF